MGIDFEQTFTRRQLFKRAGQLAAAGLWFLSMPQLVRAQEQLANPETPSTDEPALVEQKRDYSKLKIFSRPKADMTDEQLPINDSEIKSMRKWLGEELFPSIDDLTDKIKNEPGFESITLALQQSIDDFILLGEQFLSEREVGAPVVLPSFQWNEPAKNPGIPYGVTTFVMSKSSDPNKVSYFISLKAAALPAEEKNQYNKTKSNIFSILQFLLAMKFLTAYRKKIASLDEADYNRDQFFDHYYNAEDKKLIVIADNLSWIIDIHDKFKPKLVELGFDSTTPLFDEMSEFKQAMVNKFSQDQFLFEWRKFVNRLFFGNRVPEELLK